MREQNVTEEQDKPTSFILTQLDEALEERQNPDRRTTDKGADVETGIDRRKGDRRADSAKN